MLQLDKIRKTYGTGENSVPAVRDFTLSVGAGEFFTFLGPSGCGKTTGLRMVAGLETPSGGEIRIGDATVYSDARGTFVPVNRRDIAMVFQSYAIWPHMTVAENVRFPLDVMGLGRRDAQKRVEEALATVGMERMQDRPATDLSGGQQQRVALARALVKNAKLLLLDEPLSNLDAELRVQMRRELRALQAQLGVTFIYVTHDQEEAMSMSDRVAIIKDGCVVEIGTPKDLYYRPRERFTATFLGLGELWDATVVAADATGVEVESMIGRMRCGPAEVSAGDGVKLLIRPEHIAIGSPGAPASANQFRGTVVATSFSGRYVDYTIRCAGQDIQIQTSSLEIFDAGSEVTLQFAPHRCIVLK